MSDKAERVPISLRIPPEVYAWLKARADDNGRSNNNEILQILKAARQAEQQRTAA